MGLSMRVDGSPASCRACARSVRALARALEQCADGVANVRSTALGAWTGDAAEQFGGKAGRMIKAGDTLSAGLITFAAELEAQADAIEETRSEMQRARSIATGAGIAIRGDDYPLFDDVELKPGQEGPRDHGEAVVTRARQAEEAAASAFTSAASAVQALTWDVEPASSQTGELSGPSDMLPDFLPDIDGFGLGPPLPGMPLPLPTPIPLIDGLASPIRSGLTELAPRLPGLIKLHPLAREAAFTMTEKAGQALLSPVTAGYDQYLEDQDREDLDLTEKLRRAALVGTATGAGGAGATYACTQSVVLAPFSPGCGLLGAEAANRLSKKWLEFEDAH